MDAFALIGVIEAVGRPPPPSVLEQLWTKISTYVSELHPLEKIHFSYIAKEHPLRTLVLVLAAVLAVWLFIAVSKKFSKP